MRARNTNRGKATRSPPPQMRTIQGGCRWGGGAEELPGVNLEGAMSNTSKAYLTDWRGGKTPRTGKSNVGAFGTPRCYPAKRTFVTTRVVSLRSIGGACPEEGVSLGLRVKRLEIERWGSGIPGSESWGWEF